jgi:hypothetical protein
LRKARKIHSLGQTRKPINQQSRSEKRSDSASAFVTASEQANLNTRSRPLGTSPPVYAPLLNQIIPPEGTVMPPIEKPQPNDQRAPSSGKVQQPELIRLGAIAFIDTLYISVVLGSLLHSWWVLGESLLIGLTVTGIIVLSRKRETFQVLMAILLWFGFALIWGYIGWLVSDSYMPLIIRCLYAFIGFILGLFGHYLISVVVNSKQMKSIREIKYCILPTFIDSVCISLVFGYLLHSWWMLGISLLVGLTLTGIIVLLARDNIHAPKQAGVDIVWFLFALMWGYTGWLIFDSHIPSIIHFLCALIGFILGFIGYPVTYAFLSPTDLEE